MTPREMRRRVREGLPYGDVLPPAPPRVQDQENLFAQLTSASATEGRYPATLYFSDQTGTVATFTAISDAGGVWVKGPNGETLTTSTYYPVRLAGTKTADGKSCYDVVGKLSSATAEEVLHLYVTRTGDQSINNLVLTNITWQAETYDSGWSFTPPSADLTPPGSDFNIFLIDVLLEWEAGAGTFRYAEITSASTTVSLNYDTFAKSIQHLSAVIVGNNATTINVKVMHDHGSALNIKNSVYTHCTVTKIAGDPIP